MRKLIAAINMTLDGFCDHRITKALNPYENVVLLFPCADKEESLKFIYKRRNIAPIQRELIEHLVFDESNFKLAKHTVFVKDKTPEDVCNEVLSITNNLKNGSSLHGQ